MSYFVDILCLLYLKLIFPPHSSSGHSFFSMKVIPYGPTFGICRLCINTVLSFPSKLSLTQMSPKMVKHLRGEKHRGLFSLYTTAPSRFPLFNASATFDELMVAFCKLRGEAAQKWLQKFGYALEGGTSELPAGRDGGSGEEEEEEEVELIEIAEVKPALEDNNKAPNFNASSSNNNSSTGSHHVQAQHDNRIWTVL